MSLTELVAALSAVAIGFGAIRGYIAIAGRQEDAAADRKVIFAHIESINSQLTTLNGEISRVRIVEQKLENGLMERTGRIETKLEHLTEMVMERM